MQTISINFIVPQGWHELSDKQLRYVYQLLPNLDWLDLLLLILVTAYPLQTSKTFHVFIPPILIKKKNACEVQCVERSSPNICI